MPVAGNSAAVGAARRLRRQERRRAREIAGRNAASVEGDREVREIRGRRHGGGGGGGADGAEPLDLRALADPDVAAGESAVLVRGERGLAWGPRRGCL